MRNYPFSYIFGASQNTHIRQVVAELHLTSRLVSHSRITYENPSRESARCDLRTFVPLCDHMCISYVAERTSVSLNRSRLSEVFRIVGSLCWK